MPGYKGHITAALLFCGLLYLFPFWQPLPLYGKLACIALAVFFGLFPDIDTKSKGQYIFLVLFIIADVVLIYRQLYKQAAYMGLLVVIPVISRHRGWTHSIAAMLMIPGAAYLAATHYANAGPFDFLPYLLAALFGYASHIVLDTYW